MSEVPSQVSDALERLTGDRAKAERLAGKLLAALRAGDDLGNGLCVVADPLGRHEGRHGGERRES